MSDPKRDWRYELRSSRGPCDVYDLASAAIDELERLEREKAEWSGIAAQRNVSIALIAEERDRLRATLESLKWPGVTTINALDASVPISTTENK